MDSKHTAYEKMLCIKECSNNIFKALNISANVMRTINESSSPIANTPTNEEHPLIEGLILDTKYKSNSKSSSKKVMSADEYLPAFIYIVLKTNPTMLHSNTNFIKRFGFEKRIGTGLDDYQLTTLVNFISK